MKYSAFALLLVIAGAFAAPGDVVQPQIMDIWLKDTVQRVSDGIAQRGYDPLNVNDRNVNIVIIERAAELVGTIESLQLTGASGIVTEYASYNIIMGQLSFSVSITELSLTIGGLNGRFVYGDVNGSGTANGTLVITNIRISGVVLLKYDTGSARIYNINVSLTVDNINSNLSIIGSRDYSDTANNFLNVRVFELFDTYRNEINTVLGELIKRGVERWQDRS